MPTTLDLAADCSRCVGRCCVMPSFRASADFALTKPAGTPCPHLDAADRCSIHDRLRDVGFRACTVYDCFGAGQRLVRQTFSGRGWRGTPDVARAMFDAFPAMRDLHELLWYVTDALRHVDTPGLRSALVELQELGELPAAALARLDTLALWDDVRPMLSHASAQVRAAAPGSQDLTGADLGGADLSGADLSFADVLGADFRNADVAGADLSRTLFLVQAQLNTARGDATMRLPEWLQRPAHWA